MLATILKLSSFWRKTNYSFFPIKPLFLCVCVWGGGGVEIHIEMPLGELAECPPSGWVPVYSQSFER